MAYSKELVDVVDERIRAAAVTATAVGSVVTRTGATTAMVTFDGSNKATPVKCFGDVNIDQGDRVGMVRLGVDWTIVGTFTRRRTLTIPDGAGPGEARIVMGSVLPPPLDTYLYYGTMLADAATIYYEATPNDDSYTFWAHFSDGSNFNVVAGFVVNGAVMERAAGIPRSMSWFHGPTFTVFRMDLGGFGQWSIDGVSQPRGLSSRIDSTANSAAIGITETTVLTLPSETYVGNRAYATRWRAGIAGSAAGALGVRVRKTNPAGQQLSVFGWTFPAAQTLTFSDTNVFNVAAGASVTASLVLTTQSGAGTNTHIGAATDVRYLEVFDCGQGSDFVNAPTLA